MKKYGEVFSEARRTWQPWQRILKRWLWILQNERLKRENTECSCVAGSHYLYVLPSFTIIYSIQYFFFLNKVPYLDTGLSWKSQLANQWGTYICFP